MKLRRPAISKLMLWGLCITLLALTVFRQEVVAFAEVSGPRPSAQSLTSENDQARQAAREIAERYAAVPNIRSTAPHGTWTVVPEAEWSIRPEAECLADLEAQKIAALLLRHPFTKIPAPVILITKVEGVTFRSVYEGGPLLYACELAARLPVLAKIVQRQKVHTVDVLCAFRLEPETSFHKVGMGLDIVSFQTDSGELNVAEHFLETPDHETCSAPQPLDTRARALLDIACDLGETHTFSTVITPNYRRGHRDHFHLDIRPDDPRFFVR